MSNFSSIPEPFRSVVQHAQKAEAVVYDDTTVAGFYIRLSLEAWVHWIYQNEPSLQLPYDTNIGSMMKEPEFVQLVHPEVLRFMHSVRLLGNRAVHSVNKAKIKTEEAIHALKLLHGITGYFVNQYSEEYIVFPNFDEDKIPLAQQIQRNILNNQIKELQEQSQQKVVLEKQLEAIQQEVERLRLQSQPTLLPPQDPNEALTRSFLIDPLLEEMGWNLSQRNIKEFPVEGMSNDSGKGAVDYVLWGDNGKPLAVVEAKRASRDVEAGRHQAELYAKCLEKQFGQLPNIFLTNGYHIHFYDWEYPIREVQGFYTKDELELNIQRRNSRKSLKNIEINAEITDRYYQQEAIKAVCERFEAGHRGALLVMATGTGKTRTAASLIDVLSKNNWTKRVLFLADRTALVTQAKNNLNNYLPHFSSVNLVTEKENPNARLVFSTYQTLINLIDSTKNEDGKYFGVGHFDLIIFDEIHRSVYNKYKAIFNYFDGFKIGLTATPKDATDKNTYELFGLTAGNPTYNYDLDKAIKDGYLVPYKSYSVQTKFQRDGIKYCELSEEEKREYEELFGDPEEGAPDEIDANALDNWLFNNHTADLILEELMNRGIKAEGGNMLGKTIIFTKKSQHADFIRKRFNDNYPQYKDQFLKVIDYREEYKHDLLNDFKDKNKLPQIACSVDMLDTGIDVPEVVNLVFLKPVKSSVKFWQMIGRGTRLCKDLFGYQDDKKEFLILDFCQNFEFFAVNPKGQESKRQASLNEKLFLLRLRISQLLIAQQDTATQELGRLHLDYLHQQVVNLFHQHKTSFVVRPHLKLIEQYTDRNAWEGISQSDFHELNTEIAPLVFDEDKDVAAKQFDLQMFYLTIALINGESYLDNSIAQVVNASKKLQKQTRIPQVQAKMDFLQTITTDVYWQNATPTTVEKLRLEIRELMKFLDEKTKKAIALTDFEDEVIRVGESPVVYENKSFDKEAYREKVERFIRENKNNITIDKIRRNIKITQAEIDYLEEMLFSQGNLGSKEVFEKAFGEQPLGKFVRSVVGLDKTEAKNAFAQIINGADFNTQQMAFMNTLIDYFSENGIVELSDLKKPDFTYIHSEGIMGLFDMDTSFRIRNVMEEINSNCDTA